MVIEPGPKWWTNWPTIPHCHPQTHAASGAKSTKMWVKHINLPFLIHTKICLMLKICFRQRQKWLAAYRRFYIYNLVQYLSWKEVFSRFYWYLLKPLFPRSASSVNSLSWYSAWHPLHSAIIEANPHSLAPVKGITVTSCPLFTKNACFGIHLDVLSISGFNTLSHCIICTH